MLKLPVMLDRVQEHQRLLLLGCYSEADIDMSPYDTEDCQMSDMQVITKQARHECDMSASAGIHAKKVSQ